MPIEDVPLIRDDILAINREFRLPSIVATYMLESFITHPTPTRAEVTDITEALCPGADATIISSLTAHGPYQFEAIIGVETAAESFV